MPDQTGFLGVDFLARFQIGEGSLGVACEVFGRRIWIVAGGFGDSAFIETKNGNALSREVVRQDQKRAMASERFIAVVGPGTTKENGRGKRARARRKCERARERNAGMGVRERDFLLFVWIRLSGILRANQFKKLVGTPKLEPLLDAALRPSTGDDRLCGVEHAIVDAAHNRYFKMEGGIFLANFGGWQAIDALVGAIERGEELMLIVMRDVQLQAEAHAVAFERALPNSLGGKD